MKPTFDDLSRLCVGVEAGLVRAHLERLGDDYFEAFPGPTVARHLQALAALAPDNPVESLIESGPENRVELTVLAYDYPAEFSLISGVLAGTGLSVLWGDIYTYAPAVADANAARRRPPFRPAATEDRPARRCIIDVFRGELDGKLTVAEWSRRVLAKLREVLRLLEIGGHRNASWAKQTVNELVAARLRALQTEQPSPLYPVHIEVANDRGPYTVLRVVSEDTPAFLYSLSNALALQGVSIERLRINTVQGRIEDELGLLDSRGHKIEDPAELDRVKFSVLLTKQFTYFLGRAPAPYAALSRFELLVRQVHERPDARRWLGLFSDAEAMKDLARILGASDFLWEDFVRNQYEALLPILRPATAGSRPSFARADVEARLQTALKGVDGFGERVRAVNAWKDREVFLIDMDHILHAHAEAPALAEPLTRLAEVVVQWAVSEAQDHLAERHGLPRTVGRLRAPMAVFGLGKFGGEALGYASDIELLFVYGDNGATDGNEPIGNAEFFSRLVEETVRSIAAKQTGIFRVDIRLRPHGRSGPKACSLESFCRYYEPGGPALSYERLALTRLRFVAGDADLGRQVERLRDEFVYHPRAIDTFELQDLRERQLHEKAGDSDRYNAKFSPGGLVDLEYCVQMLQVLHGKDRPELRTPRIHLALAALSQTGVMEPHEAADLTDAYYFLRRLVNGLRMLRGNALDLFLPEERSDEYAHLARRMGYEADARLSPEQQLLVDFETRTAVIRAFIARHFGRERLPDPDHGNIADLLLSENISEALRRDVFGRIGVRQTDRAYANLRRLAERDPDRPRFSRLAVLVADALKRSPDPDMALNNWERFAGVLPDPAAHYTRLLDQPKRIEILLAILAGSQFLADALVRNPEFFDWVTDPAVLHGRRGRDVLAADLDAFAVATRTQDEWLNAVRRFHRRETLRIGTRDIGLHAPTEDILADLSALADALVDRCLTRVWDRLAEKAGPDAVAGLKGAFCVLALGKLGGAELNYSSDIDLLGIHDDGPAVAAVPDADALFHKAMDGLRHALSTHTEEGYAYRVDLRLRPHGRSGRLTPSLASVTEYYSSHAALWEVQSLLKIRPIAGSAQVGQRFVDGIRPILAARRDRATVANNIRAMRERAVQTHGGDPERDAKTGPGGIRDIEFLVQGLQLIHAASRPAVLTGNTLDGLARLSAEGILPTEVATRLRSDYVFLRRVEHCLQVLENRQVHDLPESQESLGALAKRVLGPDAAVDGFLRELRRVRDGVREAYVTHLV